MPAFELKFLADTRDVLAQMKAMGADLGAAAKEAAGLGQQLGLTTTSVDATTAAATAAAEAQRTLSRDVAETSAAFGQAEPATSAFGQAVQKVGGFLQALGTSAQQGLAKVNASIPDAAAKLAEIAAEVASFATGTGLVVTPMLLLGSQFGNLGTVAAAAGAAFVIFSARAAGVRAAVLAFSDAVGLSALRTALFSGVLSGASTALGTLWAALLPILPELLAVAAAILVVYAGFRTFTEGMAAADARIANLKTLEKLSHDATQAAAALRLVQAAASDTGFSDAAMTKAYVTLAGLKDESLLTVANLKAVAGMATTAKKPVEDLAGQLAAVFRGVRQGGDEGQKATRAAINVLQQEGVFADRARDRIEALQKAHADEATVLRVVRGEIAQYTGAAETGLRTVSGEWARLKQQSAEALGDLFTPLAELKNALGDVLAVGIHKLTDAIQGLRGVIRNELQADVTAFLGTMDEIRVAYDTFERWTTRLRELCDALEAQIVKLATEALGGLKSTLDGVLATVESWGAGFMRVLDSVIGKVGELASKLAGVLGMQSAVAAGQSQASSGHGSSGGAGDWGSDPSTLPSSGHGSSGGAGDWGSDPSTLPGWMTNLTNGFQQDYTDAKRDLEAGKAKAKADADKAKADAFAHDADRAVNPTTYDDAGSGKGAKGGGGGGGAAGRKKEVDLGAEAEKHYRQELDLTKSSLALGEISSSQAQAQNSATIRTYIARLQELQSALPKTADKYRELTVRIKDAQQTLAQQSVFGNVKYQLTQLVNEWGNAATQIGNFAKQTAQTISSTIGSAVTDMIFRTGNWRQTMAQAAKSIIGSLVQIGVQMLISNTLGQTLTAANVGTQAAAGAAIATANAPAAAATSISSYGAAAAIGGAAAAAAIALIIGLISGGFREGGYTGDGHPSQPMGIVHAGEFVMPAPVVDRLGVGALTAIASGGFPMTRPLTGYQGGGFVGGGGYSATGTASGSGFGGAAGAAGTAVHVHYHANEEAMAKFVASNRGRHIILDHVGGGAVDLGLHT